MYINRFDILSAQSSIYVSFCAPYILVVLVIGLLILSKIVSLVFGFKRRMQGKNSGQRTTYSSQNYQSNPRQEETTDSYSTQGDVPVRQRKKIFDKDEGEYVEFEEIK